MTQDEYEARILFERWQARVWLAEKLLEARRRYWTYREDPIRREDERRAAYDAALYRLETRAAMSVLDPSAFRPIVTVIP